MQTIYLDISNRGVLPTVYAKQGDVGRKFLVVLTDSNLPYTPVGGSAFSVWYSGASGEGNYTDIGGKSAFSVNGNKVTVEMISQMVSKDGDGVLSLVLNDPNGNQISTWNIAYVCEFVPGADSEEAKKYYTAFSDAVKNLPYPDASLSVHGKAADAAAVGQAIAGISPAQIGAAPASHVSDKNNPHGVTPKQIGALPVSSGLLNSDTNFDAMQSNMIAWVNPWVGNNTGVHVPPKAGFIHSFEYSGQEVQRFYDTNGILLYRIKGGEWEYENPPMELIKEYRTTERWQGKVVYTKLIDCLALPNTAEKQVPHNLGCKRIIRLNGVTSNGLALPSDLRLDGQEHRIEIAANTYAIYILTTSDYSDQTATVQLWYTRD